MLIERFTPYCERIVVAGSIRRKKPTIGDLELVAIPVRMEQTNLFGDVAAVSYPLFDYLDSLVRQGAIQKIIGAEYGRSAWGDRLRKFLVTTTGQQTIYKVDLFLCVPETWGDTLTIRTGPKGFSAWLVTKRSQGGAMPDNMRHIDNRLWRESKPLDAPTEQAFFDALGLLCIPPEQRGGWVWKPGAWDRIERMRQSEPGEIKSSE